MALVTFGGGVTAISGRIGGNVFAKTGSVRAGTPPTNPATQFQQDVRALIGMLTNVWVNVLTATQREAWETYALNVPVTNRLGQSKLISGIAHYVRSNVTRLQPSADAVSPQARIDAAPTIFDLGETPVLTLDSASAAGGVIAINWDPASIEIAAARLLVFASFGKSIATNYFKGPYRLSARLTGNALQPADVVPPGAMVQGNRHFLRAVVSRDDGRVSGQTTLVVDVTA